MRENILDKLSQLDRIEYMLKDKDVSEDFKQSSVWGLLRGGILYYLFITFYCALLIFINPEASYSAVKVLADTVPIVAKVVLIVFLSLETLRCITYARKKKKLDSKFFPVEIKPKDKKK